MFTALFLTIYIIRVIEYVGILNNELNLMYNHAQRCEMTKRFIVREIKPIICSLLFDMLIVGSLFCRDF